MKTSSKLRRLQRQRKLRRQRRAFFMIVLVVILLIAHSAFSNQDTYKSTEVKSVRVCSGDTLWEIASEYKPEGTDLREFMYEIAASNGIKDCNIVAGQTIYVPVVVEA